jgi:hypothetical protein
MVQDGILAYGARLEVLERCRLIFYLLLEVGVVGDGGAPDRIGFEMLPDQFVGIAVRRIRGASYT